MVLSFKYGVTPFGAWTLGKGIQSLFQAGVGVFLLFFNLNSTNGQFGFVGLDTLPFFGKHALILLAFIEERVALCLDFAPILCSLFVKCVLFHLDFF